MAQFREKRAYPIIIDFITKSQKDVNNLLGDLITEDLGNIIASVFNGNLNLIYKVIEDNKLDEFIRAAASKALIVLVAQGIIDRNIVMEYFETLLQRFMKDEDELLSFLVYDCCKLYPEEVIFQIKSAYEQDLINSGYISWEDVQYYKDKGKENILNELKTDRHYSLISDTVNSLNWWACFKAEDNRGDINQLNNMINSADLSLENYWIPTREFAKRINHIQIESFYNISSDILNDDSPFEFLLKERDLSFFLKKFPLIQESEFYNVYMQQSPLKAKVFKYNSVYNKTGGLLNLFNSDFSKSQDMVLKSLFKELPKKEVIQKWLDISNELWNGLTPKQVWAGGGEIELKLLNDFMEYLADKIEDQGFHSEEEALIKATEVLKDWQMKPNEICGKETPYDAIIAERNKLYTRKKQLIDNLGIKSDLT